MISFCSCIKCSENDLYFAKHSAKISFGHAEEINQIGHVIRIDGQLCGIEIFQGNQGTVDAYLYLEETVSLQLAVDIIAMMIERYICRYQCRRILFYRMDSKWIPACHANGVYAKNDIFQYVVEEYRRQLEHTVFDVRGIYNQSGKDGKNSFRLAAFKGQWLRLDCGV